MFATNPYYDDSSQYQSPILAIIFKCPHDYGNPVVTWAAMSPQVYPIYPCKGAGPSTVPAVSSCFGLLQDGF